MRVAIQGERGSFHDEAARQWYGEHIEIVECDSFPEVFAAVKSGAAEKAVAAMENSLYGSINQVYDLVEEYGYPIVGEVHLSVHQQLIAVPGHEITTIYSHPVALAQCETFLDEQYPFAGRVEVPDTAGAVRQISESREPGAAAIASAYAASLYDMPIIARDIENNPANFTRFLVLDPNGTVPEDADRATIVVTTKNDPGSLARVLLVFADMGINLSKLQSRPIVGRPWHYRFYLVVDCAGERLHRALEGIEPLTTEVKVLGEYVFNP